MQCCQMNGRQAFSESFDPGSFLSFFFFKLPSYRGKAESRVQCVCVCVSLFLRGVGGEQGEPGEMSRQETHVDRRSQLSHPH